MSQQNSINFNKLGALKGEPVFFNDAFFIHPVKLGQIADVGTTGFYRRLHMATLSGKEEGAESNFQYIMTKCEGDPFRIFFQDALRFFVREPVIVLPEMEAIMIGENPDPKRFLSHNNFDDFQYIIRKQHWITEDVKQDYNPADSKAKAIIEKIKKGKSTVEDIKKRRGTTGPSFDDLVASLAARGNGLNVINIWELTYYAFYDQLHRMQMLEEYDINMRGLMAGAKIQKSKLKHWIREIQDK